MNIKFIWRNASAFILSGLGLGLLSVSCFAMVFAGNTFFESIDNGGGLKEIYSFGIVLLEIAAWILWGASAVLWNKKYKLLALVTFLSAFAWEAYSGAVHYNYFHASIVQGVKNSEVDLTVGQDYRKAKMTSLVDEMTVLDKSFESPDFGAASIRETIRSVQASASAAIRQGSTTNGDRIIEKLNQLQEKLGDAENRRAQYVLDEQRRRDERKRSIRAELDSMQAEVEQVAKGGGMTKGLDEASASVMALCGAFLLKLMSMLCSIVPGYIWSSRSAGLKSEVAVSSPPAAAPVLTVDHQPVAGETPTHEARQVACTAAKRDERLQDLMVAQPEVFQEVAQEAPMDAPGAITADSLSVGLPSGCEAFYRALLTYMKRHPKGESLPRKGITELVGVGLNSERIGEVYAHALGVGLIQKDGRSYYLTNLVDEVVI